MSLKCSKHGRSFFSKIKGEGQEDISLMPDIVSNI